MKEYFRNMLFSLKVACFLVVAAIFCTIVALFPFFRVPARFNLHSVVNRIALWYGDLCVKANQKK